MTTSPLYAKRYTSLHRSQILRDLRDAGPGKGGRPRAPGIARIRRRRAHGSKCTTSVKLCRIRCDPSRIPLLFGENSFETVYFDPFILKKQALKRAPVRRGGFKSFLARDERARFSRDSCGLARSSWNLELDFSKYCEDLTTRTHAIQT